MAYRKTDKKFGCIYYIYNNVTHKIYIGQSVNYKARFTAHKVMWHKHKHDNPYIQLDYDLYGEHSFMFGIIEDNIPKELLLKEEDFWIDVFGGINSDSTYNQENSKTLSDITRQKIGLSSSGCNNGMYGKHHKESTKMLISKANKKSKKIIKLSHKKYNGVVGKSRLKYKRQKLYRQKLKDINFVKKVCNLYLYECDTYDQLHKMFPYLSVNILRSTIRTYLGDSYNDIVKQKAAKVISIKNRNKPHPKHTVEEKRKMKMLLQKRGGNKGKNNPNYGNRKYSEDVISKLRQDYEVHKDYNIVAKLNPNVSKSAVKFLILYGVPYHPRYRKCND